MKLTYYGTAAAEGVPALWCDCGTCTKAREKGGRNVRTRSQDLVDDKILIDLPADTSLHVLSYGLPLQTIDSCIITHAHSDHLYTTELYMRHEGFAHLKNGKPFKVYATSHVLSVIKNDLGDSLSTMENAGEAELHEIKPFESFMIGDYRVTPLVADHNCPEAVFYSIEKGNEAILYAHDTGIFPEESWKWLEDSGICYDIVSFDCTNVLLEWDNRGHMGISGNEPVKNRLAAIGCINSDTKCVVNHFSHNGLAGYDEFAPIAKEKGFEVSYDGMVVEI